MRFDIKEMVKGKDALRRKLAERPISEKLRMVEVLSERALALRPDTSPTPPDAPWPIPSHWQWKKMADVATVIGGGTPATDHKEYFGGDIPWITPADLSKYTERTISHGARNITRAGLENSGARLVPSGTVLFSSRAPIGYVAIAENPVATNQGFKSFVLGDEVTPEFVYYYLQRARGLAHSLASGTTFLEISGRKASQIPIPVPPLPEQCEIVAEIEKQFTRMEAGVAALRRVQANLKRYRAAVLKAACEGRLVPTEAELAKAENRRFETGEELLASSVDTTPSKAKPRRAGRLWGAGHVPDLTDEERLTLPDGWVWAKVRDLGYNSESAVQVGPMSMKSSDFREDGVPVLNVGCVQWDRFAESKLDHLPPEKASQFDRYRIEPGDVLFTRSGTVGRCAVAQIHQKGWLMTFHLLRARPNPQKCLPAFLRTVFEGAPHIRRQTMAASVGSTRAGFNTNLLANLAIPLPPIAEQMRIVAEVERRLSVVEELQAVVSTDLQRSTRLRQAILQKTFSGER